MTNDFCWHAACWIGGDREFFPANLGVRFPGQESFESGLFMGRVSSPASVRIESRILVRQGFETFSNPLSRDE